jgi:hypothetical protein
LVFANDFNVAANTTFSLNTVQFNVLVTPGIPVTGVELHYYKDSNSGTNGPGDELSSTSMLVPTSITNVGSGFGFDLMQVSVDLDAPFTFVGGSLETVFWVGVKIAYSGASSYMEVVTTMNTPNDIYFLENGTWNSGLDEFDAAADGVISFFGDCDVISACTGAPDAGIALVNPSTGSPGSSYSVSAQGYTTATEMLFQWQSNTNGVGWIDEGAASAELLSYNAIAPSQIGDVVEWRFSSTCSNSGETVISTVATFTTVLSYCDGEAGNTTFENILNVTYAGINNTTSSHSGYNDFTDQMATVSLEGTNQISVEITADSSDYLYVFIDWNQNGTLDDAGEVYTLASSTSSAGPHTMDITVPIGAILGNTRMRVKLGWLESTPDPCGDFSYGEVEDYTVLVEDSTVSINENNMLADASLFPNPINDSTFYVYAPKLNGERVEVKISDIAGRQIFNNTLDCLNNKVSVSVNDTMTSGVYLVTLKHAGETHTYRLVKK